MKFVIVAIPAALVIALAGLSLWLYTPDLPREVIEARYHVASDDYREVMGLRIRLRDSGGANLPVVILLHGFGSSLETWDDWSRSLAHDFRVIRLDLPGFGLTGPDPTGDYSDARSLRILLAFMDGLGVQKASLVGNSLGGKLAWMFAAEHPERVDKLVLISPAGFSSPGQDYGKKPEIPAMIKVLPYVLPAYFVKMSLAPAFGDPARFSTALIARYRDFMRAPGVRSAMIARMEQDVLSDPAPWLQRLHMPVLLLWGSNDGMIPAGNSADYERLIPQAKFVELPGTGHVPQEEAPEASLRPLRAFLLGPEPG